MAYTKNPAVLRKILPHLKGLANGESAVRWRVQGPAAKWQFKVLQGLVIAKTHRDLPEFQALAANADRYVIRVLDEHTVEAQLKDTVGVETVAIPTPRSGGSSLTGRRSLTLNTPQSSLEILDFWQQAQPTNDLISVNDVSLTNAELMEVANYLASRPRPWMVLQPRGTATLVLAPNDPAVPDEAKLVPIPEAPAAPHRDTHGAAIEAPVSER